MGMILELGPGIHRSGGVDVAIDKNPKADADIIRDFAKRGIPFTENYFDEVRAYDVIEHIELYDDLIFTFNEIWRVLKNEGFFHFVTPNGVENSLSHLTHHRVFYPGSFQYIGNTCSEEFEHMRNSDNIIAKFEINFKNNPDTSILEGRFKAIK